MRTERRRRPRMAVDGLAYVNLDPDTDGVILNISEGGLCFQSRAPVEHTETIRFWFCRCGQSVEPDPRQSCGKQEPRGGVSEFIQAASELVWVDNARRKGGLRFTDLPVSAREQIRDWLDHSAMIRVNQQAAQGDPPVRKVYEDPARITSANLQALFRRMQTPKLWTGFSGGLLAGIFASALIVAAFSLSMHSREVGDSLVRLGEQLGGRSLTRPTLPPPADPPKSPAVSALSEAEPVESRVISPELQTVKAPVQPPRSKQLLPSTIPATPTSNEGNAKLAASNTQGKSTSSRPLLPAAVLAPDADPSASPLRPAAAETELADRLDVHTKPLGTESPAPGSEKYLEVGKFREKPLAERASNRLSQLGFPVTVIRSSHFMGKSYQVLVGPYASDSKAEAVHKDLAAIGFTPRSYERGSRDFTFLRPLKVGGTRLPVGDCVITWESYTPDAIVRIEGDRGMRATVEAKWMKRAARFADNAIVYERNHDGSLTLLEIRLSGFGEALVLLKGSS